MYKKNIYEVVSNERLSPRSFKMVLKGDTQYLTTPGQFVNLEIPNKYLRRPISVCDYDKETITLLYDVVGEGTAYMAGCKGGERFDILTGLGNGFDVKAPGHHPLLLGGGIGVAPLLNLGKELLKSGKDPMAILGFNTAADVILEKELAEAGIPVFVSTVDGSYGSRGFVTDAIRENGIQGDYFYACGPTPMLKSLCLALDIDGELSLEARMGCGFGACVCCSLETTDGVRRICKEGPVFRKEEIVWK